MLLLDTCNDCIEANLEKDLLHIVKELEKRNTPALDISRDKGAEGFTEFTFFKNDLAHLISIAKQEDPESYEFLAYDCMYSEGTFTCPCCGEVEHTMTVRFLTAITKDFVRATAIGIYDEWCEEFYWGRMNDH
jgi:hypothetical protein